MVVKVLQEVFKFRSRDFLEVLISAPMQSSLSLESGSTPLPLRICIRYTKNCATITVYELDFGYLQNYISFEKKELKLLTPPRFSVNFATNDLHFSHYMYFSAEF